MMAKTESPNRLAGSPMETLLTLRRQDACAGQLVIRAFTLPAPRKSPTVGQSIPVQFTETSFTPRINNPRAPL